VSGWYRNYCKY